MIEAKCNITFTDYLHAQLLHYRRRRFLLGAGLVIFGWLIPLAFLSLAGWQFVHGQTKADIGFFNSLAFGLGMPAFFCWHLWRGYNSMFLTGVERIITFSFDEDLVTVGIPARYEGRFDWKATERYVMGRRVALLYVTKTRFLVLPKRAITDTQWFELEALLSSKGLLTAKR
jgi:YcxB-like protein